MRLSMWAMSARKNLEITHVSKRQKKNDNSCALAWHENMYILASNESYMIRIGLVATHLNYFQLTTYMYIAQVEKIIHI